MGAIIGIDFPLLCLHVGKEKTKVLDHHGKKFASELGSDKFLIFFIGVLSVFRRLLPGSYIIPRCIDL
jgi:hypothetical protein